MYRNNIFKLIPLFEQYECKDFTKICNNVWPKMYPSLTSLLFHGTRCEIPYEDQWEDRDF